MYQPQMPADTGENSMIFNDIIFCNCKQAPGKVLNKNQGAIFPFTHSYVAGKFILLLIPYKKYWDFTLHEVRF